MRRYATIAAASLGLTTLCNLWMIAPLVSPSHMAVYHWSDHASALFLPTILDLCLFWLASAGFLVAAGRWPRIRVALGSAALVYLPWVMVKNWMVLARWQGVPHVGLTLFCLSTCAYFLILACWRPGWNAVLNRALRLLRRALSSVAVLGVLALCQLVWFYWRARSLNQPVPLHASVASVSIDHRQARVIWILFDELSYQQLYGHRAEGLMLPEFDRMAQQSSIFTNVIPAGIYTENVLPSLMTGQPVDAIAGSADGTHLSMHNPTAGTWSAFNQHDTVFQDALDAHGKTALAGWYHPYCRILPQVLDQCFWTSAISEAPYLDPYLAHAGSLQKLLPRNSDLHRIAEEPATLHILDYKDIFTAADRMLADQSNTFVFLHMPIPHPGGIYSRATGNFATSGASYLDNLALADQYLAHVHALLARNGKWDSSTIVLMGDHSWRTQLLWSSSPEWTPEEQLASHGGQFDDRPAYIVKLPNQKTGRRIDTSYAAVRTRSLLDELLAGRITSPEQLAAWTKNSGHAR